MTDPLLQEPKTMTAEQVLNTYYLEVRCKLLEMAAIFDRYDRADGPHDTDDPRWQKCRQALDVLSASQAQPNRAEQIGLIFSDPVDTNT